MTYNESLKNQLLMQARSGRVQNAYLITGGTREERLEMATAFAKELVQSPADLIFPAHEKKHLFSVDDVRREINETVRIRPYGGGRKVYILEDAALLNEQAENALLKTLEEPPVYVTIILLAEGAAGFLATILSRTVKLTLSEDTRAADEEDPLAEEMLNFLRKADQIRPADAILLTKTMSAAKDKDAGSIRNKLIPAFDVVRTWFRDVSVAKAGGTTLYRPECREAFVRTAKGLSPEGINRILTGLKEAESNLDSNVNTEGTLSEFFRTLLKEYEVFL